MKLSIVIPAYNEAHRIMPTLQSVQLFIEKNYKNEAEIIIVNDGSTDSTENVLKKFKYSNCKLISLPKNMGKGYAVRKGISESSGEHILFMDADSSTPISELPKLLNNNDDYDIVIGSRYSEDSEISIKAPWYRKIITTIGRHFVHFLLKLPFKDTQCGFKLFKRASIQPLLKELSINNFSFDIELLIQSLRRGYSIKEVPVVWNHAHGSRFHPFRDTVRAVFDILKIYWKSTY